MFKNWLKEFFAVLLCAITLICSVPTNAFASGYKKDDESGAYTYYIVDGKAVKTLFDFGIKDIVKGDAVDWLFNFKSFTVIKEFTDDYGEKEYKVYFNTPNLQSIVKNQVISMVTDGYTDDTYDVNETEAMVGVGLDEEKQNAITKYGFAIPNYTYYGEYPKEIMTVANIVPKNFWAGLWRAILSIFGVSFIDAPNADNFNTISYLNHQYEDSSDVLLEFIQKYYLKYFVNYINTDNFATPEDLIEASVTEEEDKVAKGYLDEHEDQYRDLSSKHDTWVDITDEENEKLVTNNRRLCSGYTLKENKFHASSDMGDYTVEEWLLDDSDKYQHQQKFAQIVGKMGAYRSAMEFLACAANRTNSVSYSTDKELVQMWYDASAFAESSLGSLTIYSPSKKNHTSLSDFFNNYDSSNTFPDYNDSYQVDVPHSSYDSKTGKWSHWTTKETRYVYKRITSIYGTNPTVWYGNKSISLSSLISFINNASLFGGFTDLELEDFLTTDEQIVYDSYNYKQKMHDNYTYFKERFGKGEKEVSASYRKIGYSQCLIKSEKSKECLSKKDENGKQASISVASLYAYSGLFNITKKAQAENRDLTIEEAILVINKMQTYCGPYYEEVLGNLMTIMTILATTDSPPNSDVLKTMMKDDPRTMPFDVDQLPADDRENYDFSDPRVKLYKSHVIGGLISNFNLNFGFGIFIKPQQLLVKLGGKITEVSVMLQQLCNFDKLDDLGLSPTYMWQSAFITLLLGMLALFFICKTVYAIIKMGSKSTSHLVVGFIILVLELGFVTAFALNPEGMWTNIKNIETNIISLGEKTSTTFNDPNTRYLFGDAGDAEVLYYIPYLDLWSRYNTGYGLSEDEQLMKVGTSDEDKASLKNYDPDSIRIGTQNVKHYSILLADSFSYWGNSTSVVNSVIVNDHAYNGVNINNNAYRVVDHFMAPRVNVIDKGNGKLEFDMHENENYNGEFQSGFIDLICKLMNCALMCLLSIIKFFTFLWQWFMLYVFVFRIILAKGAEGKNWGLILLETFAPTLAMIFIGMYSGIILQLGMIGKGFIGIILEIFLFWVTFMVIRWWNGLKQGIFFPKSLKWLYILTNMKQFSRHRQTERLRQEAEDNAKDAGIVFTQEEQENLDKRTEKLFNEDGSIKSEYNSAKYSKVYQDWYKFACNTINNGERELSPQERQAMALFENNERFKDYVKNYNNKVNGKKIGSRRNRQQDYNESISNQQNNIQNQNSND